MKYLSVLILLVLVKFSCGTKVTKRKVKDSDVTYIENNELLNFPQAQTWCDFLGGHLPFIQSQDDMDFLADKVIQKNVGNELTWLGMTKRQAPQCNSWLDGSQLLFNFDWYGACDNDQHCHSPTECALMVRSKGNDHKRVCMFDYLQKARVVCVVEISLRNHVEALMKTVDDLRNDLETSRNRLMSLDEMCQMTKEKTKSSIQGHESSIKQLQQDTKDTLEKMDSIKKASEDLNHRTSELKESTKKIRDENQSTEKKLKTSNVVLYLLLAFVIIVVGVGTFAIVRQHNEERKRMKVTQTAFKNGQDNAVAIQNL